jgi:hypothetical protein
MESAPKVQESDMRMATAVDAARAATSQGRIEGEVLPSEFEVVFFSLYMLSHISSLCLSLSFEILKRSRGNLQSIPVVHRGFTLNPRDCCRATTSQGKTSAGEPLPRSHHFHISNLLSHHQPLTTPALCCISPTCLQSPPRFFHRNSSLANTHVIQSITSLHCQHPSPLSRCAATILRIPSGMYSHYSH